MIREEICTYEVCELAKEKGFDVPTDFCYEQNGCLVSGANGNMGITYANAVAIQLMKQH